jgi:phasin family protein
MTQQQAEFFDLYRAGLKTAADLLKTSLESAERVQNQQLAAIRSALEQQSKSASELGQAKSLDELMALQSKLAGAQIERAIGFWHNFCQIAGENQVAAIGQVQQQVAQARNWFNEGYALTARATEEAAKFAAAQVATVNAGVRQGASRQENRKSV